MPVQPPRPRLLTDRPLYCGRNRSPLASRCPIVGPSQAFPQWTLTLINLPLPARPSSPSQTTRTKYVDTQSRRQLPEVFVFSNSFNHIAPIEVRSLAYDLGLVNLYTPPRTQTNGQTNTVVDSCVEVRPYSDSYIPHIRCSSLPNMRDRQLHRARIVSIIAATLISLACGSNVRAPDSCVTNIHTTRMSGYQLQYHLTTI